MVFVKKSKEKPPQPVKLTSKHFEEFNRQIEHDHLPVFYYGKPIIKTNEELPQVMATENQTETEYKAMQQWTYIQNCIS